MTDKYDWHKDMPPLGEIRQLEKYEPLDSGDSAKYWPPMSELELKRAERRAMQAENGTEMRLIATIRALQDQLAGAQGAVEQLLNENELLKHERDRYVGMLRKFSPKEG